MSQISNAAASSPAAGATASRPYPLTGRVVGPVRYEMSKGVDPKPYAIFTYEYAVKGRDGRKVAQTLTGKAFGKGLENVMGALDAGGDVTMIGRFEATPLGRTINFYAMPSKAAARA